MVFLEKKNIIKKEFLHAAAYEVGLDAARLLRDLEGKAQELFRQDLMKADELHVKVLPTLFFSNKNGVELALNGYQPYQNFVEILENLKPGIQKSDYNKSPEYLFNRFQTLTTREYAMLRDENEFEALYTLNEMLVKDQIKQYESPSGNMWINNFTESEPAHLITSA
jgi:thioredoxin-related protein